MSLDPGRRLGAYEIVAPAGAGGMGEVYRATDTRLGRTVAIKILPAHLANSPDLKQRLEREARSISALQHPHICVLHDVGHDGATDFLVMEYLEGDTLAERLLKGRLALDQALRIAGEVASALAAAHRHGIVHRDLKPSNVMLTAAGAKLMDFGLAKPAMMAQAAGTAAFSPSSPTSPLAGLTSPVSALTQHGAIVGTYQYMAPETLEGKPADARSDIFSFGCMLYEMLTGRRAFEGKTSLGVLAAIMERDPEPVTTAVPGAPPELVHILNACLAKDPEERWQSARDLQRGLAWVREQAGAAPARPAAPAGRLSRRVLTMAAGGAVLLMAITAGLGYTFHRAAPAAPVRFGVEPPEGGNFDLVQTAGAPAPPAVSPDGRMIVFGAHSGNEGVRLWLRRVDTDSIQELPGTDGGYYPFWSPDSRYVAYFQSGKLMKLAITGGVPDALAAVNGARGGSWGADGQIVFAPDPIGPLFMVPAGGGTARQIATPPDAATSFRWPLFLPDGKHLLYLAASPSKQTSANLQQGIFDLDLVSGKSKRVIADLTNVSYSALPGHSSGQLFFMRDANLMWAPFDAARGALTGDAVALGNIDSDASRWYGVFSAAGATIVSSKSGSSSGKVQLSWYDRSGKQLATVGQPADFTLIRLSPDGTRIAALSSIGDIWLVDERRKLQTRLFPGPDILGLIWSPDGTRLAYSNQTPLNLMIGTLDSANPPVKIFDFPKLLTAFPNDWSHDGNDIAFFGSNNGGLGIFDLALENKEVRTIVAMQNGITAVLPRLSPDGHWLAYMSNDSGRLEVYVRPFPSGDQRWQVSSAGGSLPIWTRAGREIVYITPGGELMAADVTTPAFSAGIPHELFSLPAPMGQIVGPGVQRLDASPDGNRFLIAKPLDSTARVIPLSVTVNWRPAS
jgi:Tol biopolymer transport system component